MAVKIRNSGDVRAECARRRWTRYQFAGFAKIHPSRLSLLLTDQVPISEDVLARCQAVFDAHPVPGGSANGHGRIEPLSAAAATGGLEG